MHCREFKDRHVSFVDDLLAGVESHEMHAHILECPHCARHDAKIRRALLLVKNLPTIQPSADFSARLQARLAESAVTEADMSGVRKRVSFAATLAAAAMIGYIALTLYRVEVPRDVAMAPVIASVPESEMAPLSSPPPALVASAPSGLAMWPAALFAEQASTRFVHSRYADAALRR
jgi:hypothetical protein